MFEKYKSSIEEYLSKKTKGVNVEKCIIKKIETEIKGYEYYIYNQKNEIILIYDINNPILRLKQRVQIKKDEFGNLPESLREKETVFILEFRVPSEDSGNLIIQVLNQKNKKTWISPDNIQIY